MFIILMGCKKKADREFIKTCIQSGMKDEEVGRLVGRKKDTIRIIREYELGIYIRNAPFYMKQWRRVWWRNCQTDKRKVDQLMLYIPVTIAKLLFPPRSKMIFKITVEQPNKMIIEFDNEMNRRPDAT
jgi:hypothetical protein